MTYFLPIIHSCCLRSRWQGEERRIKAIFEAIEREEDWTKYIVKHESHEFNTLPLGFCAAVEKVPGDIGPRDLRGIKIFNQSFVGKQGLADACLDFSEICDSNFSEACLNSCSFKYANISGEVGGMFYKSSLSHTSFKNSTMSNITFDKSEGHKICLKNAVMKNVSFDEAKWKNVYLSEESFIEPFLKLFLLSYILRIFGIWKGTKIKNIYTHPQFVKNCDFRFRRFIYSEYQINRLKMSNKILSFILYIFSDYGKNLSRLAFSCLITWIFFGLLYSSSTIYSSISNEKTKQIVQIISPKISWGGNFVISSLKSNQFLKQKNFIEKINLDNPQSWSQPYYFSLVTMTSLGSGDINPIDTKAEIYICLETIMGFIFLSVFVGSLMVKIDIFKNYTVANSEN